MTSPLWFTENFESDKGRRVQVAYDAVLEKRQSPFQTIEVFQTLPYGKMLVLDGVIMLTEFDHFAYHEMMTHVPLNAHPNPRKVLVVGGGDGGTITEILKHSSVEEVVLCEIDEAVIEVCKEHFHEFRHAFSDKRLTIMIEDASKYIESVSGYFDVICVDSSDPVGPAEVLFLQPFYRQLSRALTPDGIAVTQSESMYYHTDFIRSLISRNQEIFPVTQYYYTVIPTYPGGTIGFSFCSKKWDPMHHLQASRIAQVKGYRYYNESIHRGSFALPEFMVHHGK